MDPACPALTDSVRYYGLLDVLQSWVGCSYVDGWELEPGQAMGAIFARSIIVASFAVYKVGEDAGYCFSFEPVISILNGFYIRTRSSC